MADFSALKTSIQNYIKENGNEEITGNLLQQILLSMVTTLGDSAINDLVTALNAEIANRGNADTTLQGNINSEAAARGNADTELGGRITTLQGVVNGIKANVENGYVYAGIATPSTTPASGKVFYLALTAGTYTNFGATVVPQGINILKYNGQSWSLDSFLGLDDAPTQGSNNLVKSGGVLDSIIKDGSAFDLSAYNNGTTYADLSAALTALNALPAAYKKGGMSFKYVQTYDNKYVQYRLMSDSFNTTVTDWQGVDDEPEAGSGNLVTSGGVFSTTNKKVNATDYELPTELDTFEYVNNIPLQHISKGDKLIARFKPITNIAGQSALSFLVRFFYTPSDNNNWVIPDTFYTLNKEYYFEFDVVRDCADGYPLVSLGCSNFGGTFELELYKYVSLIDNEATARGNADTELGGRITTLQGVVNGIVANVENGYVYAGIATPSATPVSGKVFYLALTAGTYTNFGATVVPQGINILKYNGQSWSLDSFLGLDDAPTQGSNNFVKSGGVLDSIIKDGSAFDLSAYNNGTTYADLSAALTALNALPAAYKKGGMSMKYVQSSDNKYVQYRLMSDSFNTTVTDWQGVDDEPEAGSGNLVTSGGVFSTTNKKVNATDYELPTELDTFEYVNNIPLQHISKGDKLIARFKPITNIAGQSVLSFLVRFFYTPSDNNNWVIPETFYTLNKEYYFEFDVVRDCADGYPLVNLGCSNFGGTFELELYKYVSLKEEIEKKQDTLVSGQNIKTINGLNILGSGNINIGGGSFSGKKILWLGTSIPQGSLSDEVSINGYTGHNNYPEMVGHLLGCTVYNEAVGGSRIAASRTPEEYNAETNPIALSDGVETMFPFYSSLCATIEEKDYLYDNWASLYQRFIDGVATPPVTKAQMEAFSFEKKVIDKYISDNPSVSKVDVIFLDHGFNDRNNTLFDTTPTPYSDTERFYYKGAMAYLIRKILESNSRAHIVIGSVYSNISDPQLKINIAQKEIAETFCVPFINYEHLLTAWNGQLLYTRGYWDANEIWHETGLTWEEDLTKPLGYTTNMNGFTSEMDKETWETLYNVHKVTSDEDLAKIYPVGTTVAKIPRVPMLVFDNLHPHSDKSGYLNMQIAQYIAKQLENVISF